MPWLTAWNFKPDGSRVIYNANKVVYELVVPSTKPTELLDYSRANEPSGVGYGPDDTILVLDMYNLVLYRRVGKNKLDGGTLDFGASPAIADGKLYLRSQSYLYCIGEKR